MARLSDAPSCRSRCIIAVRCQAATRAVGLAPVTAYSGCVRLVVDARRRMEGEPAGGPPGRPRPRQSDSTPGASAMPARRRHPPAAEAVPGPLVERARPHPRGGTADPETRERLGRAYRLPTATLGRADQEAVTLAQGGEDGAGPRRPRSRPPADGASSRTHRIVTGLRWTARPPNSLRPRERPSNRRRAGRPLGRSHAPVGERSPPATSSPWLSGLGRCETGALRGGWTDPVRRPAGGRRAQRRGSWGSATLRGHRQSPGEPAATATWCLSRTHDRNRLEAVVRAAGRARRRPRAARRRRGPAPACAEGRVVRRRRSQPCAERDCRRSRSRLRVQVREPATLPVR